MLLLVKSSFKHTHEECESKRDFVLFPLGPELVSVMLYRCMFCVSLSRDLFVLCVACLTVFVKQLAICLGVVVIFLLNVMGLLSVLGCALLDRPCVVPVIPVFL